MPSTIMEFDLPSVDNSHSSLLTSPELCNRQLFEAPDQDQGSRGMDFYDDQGEVEQEQEQEHAPEENRQPPPPPQEEQHLEEEKEEEERPPPPIIIANHLDDNHVNIQECGDAVNVHEHVGDRICMCGISMRGGFDNMICQCCGHMAHFICMMIMRQCPSCATPITAYTSVMQPSAVLAVKYVTSLTVKIAACKSSNCSIIRSTLVCRNSDLHDALTKSEATIENINETLCKYEEFTGYYSHEIQEKQLMTNFINTDSKCILCATEMVGETNRVYACIARNCPHVICKTCAIAASEREMTCPCGVTVPVRKEGTVNKNGIKNMNFRNLFAFYLNMQQVNMAIKIEISQRKSINQLQELSKSKEAYDYLKTLNNLENGTLTGVHSELASITINNEEKIRNRTSFNEWLIIQPMKDEIKTEKVASTQQRAMAKQFRKKKSIH